MGIIHHREIGKEHFQIPKDDSCEGNKKIRN